VRPKLVANSSIAIRCIVVSGGVRVKFCLINVIKHIGTSCTEKVD